MGAGDVFITDFTAKRLKDEKMEGYDCYKIELTRKKDSDSHYSRLIMWVIKENFSYVLNALFNMTLKILTVYLQV